MSTRWSLVMLLSLAVISASCNQKVEGEGAAPAPLAVQIGAENVVSVQSGTIIVGPIISGELSPTREATVRAELGGAVLEVTVEEAQAVSKGALLARIETRTLEDARLSAASAVRSAENQLAVARRETERTETARRGWCACGTRARRCAQHGVGGRSGGRGCALPARERRTLAR